VPDNPQFSEWLLHHADAKNPKALARIPIAKRRIQSILDRETVCHQKTLEQKIAEQGPTGQRVDPHLIGLAIRDLLEQNRLRKHQHPSTGAKPWYANPATSKEHVHERLETLAPLYDHISGHGFGNLVGDALEVVTFKCLDRVFLANHRFAYMGQFALTEPKNAEGRYRKIQPPKALSGGITTKEADFIQLGHNPGPLSIECKNFREWIYPHAESLRELIIKAAHQKAIPVLVARRLHYTTRTNFLEPAGIIAHESYFQYYPADKAALAAEVRHKRSLGFTDVVASEEPHPRTIKFFSEILPRIVDEMATRWNRNKSALLEYAADEINLAQLYTAIGSPAGGKWQDYDEADEWEEY